MHMKQYPVITISREYGSGGHEIGKKLAERLGIPFYDNELITLASRDSGFPERTFHEAEDSATNGFLYAMKLMGSSAEGGVPLNNQIFMYQFSAIRNIADHGPAVIVGRCADYVLDGYKPSVNIFVQADMPHRVERIMERTGEKDPGKAQDMARKKDKCRATFYNFYSDRRWGDRKNYHLIINTSHLSSDTAVEILKMYIEQVMQKDEI